MLMRIKTIKRICNFWQMRFSPNSIDHLAKRHHDCVFYDLLQVWNMRSKYICILNSGVKKNRNHTSSPVSLDPRRPPSRSNVDGLLQEESGRRGSLTA